MPDLIYLLAVIACPVGMGLMMLLMTRGNHGNQGSPGSDTNGDEVAQLRAEVARLRAERTGDSGAADRPSTAP